MQAETQLNLNKLKDKQNSISKLICGKRELINRQYKNIIECKNNNSKILMEKSIESLRDEIQTLENELEETRHSILMTEMSGWNLISSNENIDLYKLDDEICGTYFIYLHNEPEEAGVISYNPKYSNSFYGDISYSIYDDYQGNSYAFQALCMLSKHLEENGINSIRISARKDNIPSIKTIEKYEKLNPNNKIMDFGDTSIVCDFMFKKKTLIKKLKFKKFI